MKLKEKVEFDKKCEMCCDGRRLWSGNVNGCTSVWLWSDDHLDSAVIISDKKYGCI